MTSEQFLSLIAFILGGIGSIFVLCSVMKLTSTKILKISAMVLGHNMDQIESLVDQKAENILGSILIVCALIIGIFGLLISPIAEITYENKNAAIFNAFFYVGVFVLIAVIISEKVKKSIKEKTAKEGIEEELTRILRIYQNLNKVPNFEVEGIRVICIRFFGLDKTFGENENSYLIRVAKKINYSQKF